MSWLGAIKQQAITWTDDADLAMLLYYSMLVAILPMPW